MGVVRNFIDIVGITPENELPNNYKGQIIQLTNSENIFVPESKKIDTIFQIIVNSEIKSNRIISAPFGKICVIDGKKKYKIFYSSIGERGKIEISEIVTPFNVAINMPHEDIMIENIKVYLADAYFDKIDERTIYSYCLFIIDIYYNKIIDSKKVDLNNYNTLNTFNYPRINISKGNYSTNQLSIEVAFMSDDEI
ncbi:MAG: hypothetical protein N2594_07395 [Clostridiales bacterium]|nr:hypothetical protein [Clostridiales bacterium]